MAVLRFGFWAVMASACAHRQGPTAEERLALTVAALDAAWGARGRVGLEATADVLSTLEPGDRAKPAVRWREARYEVAHGLAADASEGALEAFARARQVAGDCVEETRALDAGRGRGRAAGVDAACAGWAALAAVRWMVVFGADAASLDRARIRDWARWAGENDPAGAWASALLEASNRQDAAPLRALSARELRDVAGGWVLFEDMRRWDPQAPVPDALPATPEDQAAWERARPNGP